MWPSYDPSGDDMGLNRLFAGPEDYVSGHLNNSSQLRNTAVSIVPDGDLYLVAGAELLSGDTTEFQVCSTTVARLARVFDIMLFGCFAESKSHLASGQKWEVALPEDDPEIMGIILSVAHANVSKVPTKRTMEELYRILVITNKYDITPVLKFQVITWLQNLEGVSEIETNADSAAQFMFIAWELGHESLYKWLMDKLAKTCSIGSEGKLQVGSDNDSILDSQSIPDEVENAIRQCRMTMLSRLIRVVRTSWIALDDRDNALNTHPILCRGTHDRSMSCEASASMSLYRSLCDTGHIPLPHADTYKGTAEGLRADLNVDWTKGLGHFNLSYDPVCGRAVKFQMLMESAYVCPVVLDTASQNHFARQGRATGLADLDVKDFFGDL